MLARRLVSCVAVMLPMACQQPAAPAKQSPTVAKPELPQAQQPPANPEPPTYAGPPKTVLVELFSSQGCNSCPEADAFVGQFPELGWTDDKVVPLVFHVTYWDNLGWKDPYASQLYDQRQISYAQSLPQARADDETTLKGPYTPQMVVDGRVHFSGTLKDVAKQEVDRAANQPTRIELSPKTRVEPAEGGKAVVVEVESHASKDAAFDTDRSKIGLFAALTQRKLQTEVPRGENAGKKLDEHRVVRAFSGPKLFRSAKEKNETRFDLSIPGDLAAGDLSGLDVVVFAQDLASLGILASKAVPAVPAKAVAERAPL